nr:aromatic amino acid lyase [Knoellia sp. DB2414S]
MRINLTGGSDDVAYTKVGIAGDTGAVSEDPVLLQGSGLDLSALARVATGVSVAVDPTALERVAAHAAAALDVADRREVYGRTTGVGAAREQLTDGADGHGLGLLRSHAAGWGEVYAAPTVRAALAVRVNQLLVGTSGARTDLVTAVAALVNGPDDDLPVVHRLGSLGTGDLTALAEVGLALAGERPRAGGERRTDLAMGADDALPLMSSNAFTVAEAALLADELERLTDAATVACALSFVALQGNPESFSETAEQGMPFAGSRSVASALRSLLFDEGLAPQHIQDFFGLRTWPQVHGAVVDAVAQLRAVVEAMANAGSENPRFGLEDAGVVAHFGGFHAAHLAVAVDATLSALVRSAQAGTSRISHLLTDRDSDLPLFLAGEQAGSSGALVAEYVATSALSIVRECAAAPSSIHSAHVSRGIEDDASFAPQATARLGRALAAYRRLVAVELVCATRAVRLRGRMPRGGLAPAWRVVERLPDDVDDRDLSGDFELAERLCDELCAAPSP